MFNRELTFSSICSSLLQRFGFNVYNPSCNVPNHHKHQPLTDLELLEEEDEWSRGYEWDLRRDTMESQFEDDEKSVAFQGTLDEEDFGKKERLLAATTSI